MRRKISRLSSSLMDLLRAPEPETGSQTQVDCIRTKMLDCLAETLQNPAHRPTVWDKLHRAEDMQTLWYLRSDVMHLLSTHCGEGPAASKVADLTELFRGHLPTAQFASARSRG